MAIVLLWLDAGGLSEIARGFCIFRLGLPLVTSGDEGNRVPVVGKVTFKNGDILPRGTVIFAPDGGKGNASLHEPRGAIDGDGNYKLMTTPTLDGASPGWYIVTIIAQEPYVESKSSWDPPWLINRKYGSRQTSGLAVEVVDKAQAGHYDFQVTK